MLLRNCMLVFFFWMEFLYSNFGYVLLGRFFIENLFNEIFENWIKENIFKFFGMVNIGFEIIEEVEKNMVFFYLYYG